MLIGSLNLYCRKGRDRMRKMAKFNGTPAPEEQDRSFPRGSWQLLQIAFNAVIAIASKPARLSVFRA